MSNPSCFRCHKIILFSLIISFVLTSICFAGTIQLPQTGQGKCYNVTGAVISCAGTGQDGDKKIGAAWPNPRFAVGIGEQAQCVTDNLTGLMWAQTPDQNPNGRTWQAALDYVKTFNLCGFSDWRLPSIVELESLVNSGYNEQNCGGSPCGSNPAWLNTQGFSSVQTLGYWSSTINVGSLSNAWYVDMSSDGRVISIDKTTHYWPWPVRSGQFGTPNPAYTANIWNTGQKTCSDQSGNIVSCSGTRQDGDLKPGVAWPSPRFTYNGDGTVTDNLTRLIWLKNANCFNAQTWSNALTSSNSLASGSCGLTDGSMAGDWRLPNRRELFSLEDFEHNNPALSNTAGTGKWTEGDPFDNLQGSYWSSSSSFAGVAGRAFYFYVVYGPLDVSSKTNTQFVWPVRDGYVARLMQEDSLVNNYGKIQDAYNAAADGEIIQAQAIDSIETLTLASPANISVSLIGGYDSGFTSITGFTTINGSFNISNGAVTIANLIIR